METLHSIHSSNAGMRAERRLRGVLLANAATSALAGSVASLAPVRLDDLLGTGHPGLLRAVGIGLVAFAVEVLLVARSGRARLDSGTRLIVVADAAWVVATAVTIAVGWYAPTGAVVMGVAGVGVADFAVAQHVLRRRLSR